MDLNYSQSVLFYLFIIFGSTFFVMIPELLVKFSNIDNKLNSKPYKKNITITKRLFNLNYLLSFLIAWIPSAIRYGIGTDYNGYVNGYNYSYNIDLNFYGIIPKELGYRLLTNLIYFKLGGDPQLIFIITSFITIGLIYYTIFKLKLNQFSKAMAIFMFLSMYYCTSYNLVRQFVALAIIFYAYRYLLMKNTVKFIIYVLLACSFHLTAIIMLPIYYLIYKDVEIKKIIAIILGVIIVYILYDKALNILTSISMFSKYSFYSNEIKNDKEIWKVIVKRLPLIFIILKYRKKLLELDYKNKQLMVLAVIEIMTGLFVTKNIWLFRLSYYFIFSYVLLISQICKIEKRKLIINLYMMVYCLFYFYYNFVLNGVDEVLPYMNIFQ